MGALSVIIKKFKNNKSPGPDGIPVQLFKMTDDDVTIVPDILNYCWKNGSMPSKMELAELVTLYKKGNVENPANYSPIALLNTLYKIYASLIKKRISLGLDQRVWSTQFEFRECKNNLATIIYDQKVA